MKKILIAAVIVLALGLGASVYFCITLNQDKNALTADLNSTQNVLASTQAELASTQTELATTNGTLTATLTELDTTKATLTSTRSALSATRDTLASTQSKLDTANQTLVSKLAELSSANNQIASMQEDMTTLRDSLSGSQQQLAIAQETLDGLGITVAASKECDDVELIDNLEAQNPTWSQLMSFIADDKTEQNEYIKNVYDCSQFSRDVHNNAEAAGIRAAEVQVSFKNMEAGHALNAFITTDYGLVYIDCTTPPDTVVRVKLDKTYRGLEIYSVAGKNTRNDAWWDSLMSYYFISSSTGGQAVVSDITIFW
ncbi:MAG: hypothetical protein ABSD79_02870 [Dehalococcoidales bacterium]